MPTVLQNVHINEERWFQREQLEKLGSKLARILSSTRLERAGISKAQAPVKATLQ